MKLAVNLQLPYWLNEEKFFVKKSHQMDRKIVIPFINKVSRREFLVFSAYPFNTLLIKGQKILTVRSEYDKLSKKEMCYAKPYIILT